LSARPGPRKSAAPEILRYSFRAFVSDGVLDESELAMIESLALRDGVVDSREKAVLSRILDRIDPASVDESFRAYIQQLRDRYEIR
jgi:hypothetical protein